MMMALVMTMAIIKMINHVNAAWRCRFNETLESSQIVSSHTNVSAEILIAPLLQTLPEAQRTQGVRVWIDWFIDASWGGTLAMAGAACVRTHSSAIFR